MNYYLVNGEFEIQANNLESAYEQANALGLVIEEIEDITGFYEDMHHDLYEPDYEDDGDALASAGFGTDEDYGYAGEEF